MARFFPVRSQCRFDTAGERRFAERLEKLLEDDYLCRSIVPVGSMGPHHDGKGVEFRLVLRRDAEARRGG